MDILSLELRKLGLKEKEVAVYLAGLELGPSTAQNIAKKAEVTRPTTYEIIKVLEKKGLFAEITHNKKRAFLAQSPEKILGILRLQKKELEEKEREFIRIIATLESKYAGGEKSGIQVFQGKEEIEFLEEQILFTPVKDIVVFTSEEAKVKLWYKILEKRLGKLSIQQTITLKLQGTLFLADKAIFVSAKKQEGYLLDNPLVIDSLKRLL